MDLAAEPATFNSEAIQQAFTRVSAAARWADALVATRPKYKQVRLVFANEVLRQILFTNRMNRSLAARELGVDRETVHRIPRQAARYLVTDTQTTAIRHLAEIAIGRAVDSSNTAGRYVQIRQWFSQQIGLAAMRAVARESGASRQSGIGQAAKLIDVHRNHLRTMVRTKETIQ